MSCKRKMKTSINISLFHSTYIFYLTSVFSKQEKRHILVNLKSSVDRFFIFLCSWIFYLPLFINFFSFFVHGFLSSSFHGFSLVGFILHFSRIFYAVFTFLSCCGKRCFYILFCLHLLHLYFASISRTPGKTRKNYNHQDVQETCASRHQERA